MAGAVVEIQSGLPERATGESVDLAAMRAARENSAGDGDVALQHARIGFARCLVDAPDRDRSGDVRRAVEILPTGIDQIDALANFGIGGFDDTVMRQGRVRT